MTSRSPRRARVPLFLLFLVLSGCGTSLEVHYEGSDQAGWEPPSYRFKTLSLAVHSDVPDIEQAIKQLEFALEVEFAARRKRILPSGADLQVTVDIQSLTDVQRETRVFLGSLAGQARMRSRIRVTTPGKAPFVFAIETVSSGADTTEDFLSGKGGSTQDMVERTALGIVEELVP